MCKFAIKTLSLKLKRHLFVYFYFFKFGDYINLIFLMIFNLFICLLVRVLGWNFEGKRLVLQNKWFQLGRYNFWKSQHLWNNIINVELAKVLWYYISPRQLFKTIQQFHWPYISFFLHPICISLFHIPFILMYILYTNIITKTLFKNSISYW
jgi:hypothetical protein